MQNVAQAWLAWASEWKPEDLTCIGTGEHAAAAEQIRAAAVAQLERGEAVCAAVAAEAARRGLADESLRLLRGELRQLRADPKRRLTVAVELLAPARREAERVADAIGGAKADDLTPTDMDILRSLAAPGERAPKSQDEVAQRMARAVGIQVPSQPTVSRSVAALRRAGLVEPNHYRRTPAGESRIQSMHE